MMYPNQQPPMQGMANQMSQYGRYGDSMLVHMNPIEVQGLASLSPTGSLTINPVTGQPEAFLPFLAPLLGSLAGSAFLPTVIPALAGKAALAGAIGSGLATTAATGDLKQGILSGLTGYGLGSALQATADTLNPAIAGAEQALAGVGEQAATAASDLALSEVGLNQAINQASQTGTPFQLASKTPIGEAFSPVAQPIAPSKITQLSGFSATPQMSPALTQAQGLAETAGQTVSQQQAGLASLQGQQAGLQGQIDTARQAMTPMDRLTSPFQQPGAFGSAMMSPGTLVPIALGEGKREELRMQDEMDSLGRQEKRKRQEDLERSRQQMFGGFGQVSKDYDYSGYEVPMNYARAGGITSVNPQNYMDNLQGLQRLSRGGTTNYSPVINPAGAAQRQANIRGSEVISPAELQGYRPGFSPEIQYFRRPEPATGTPQAEQNPVMGGEGAGQLSAAQQQAINMALSGKGGMGFGGPNFDAMSYNYGANEPLSGINAGSAFTAAGMGQQGIADLSRRRSSNPRGDAYSRYTQEMQEGGEVAVDVAMQEQMPDETMAETSDANGGRLIELAALALLGRLPEEESKIVIEQFVMEFGEEALQMLRDRVLKDMSPNAQTEGKIEGNGKGMDDMVPGMIGDQQPVAVSPGEFIVPADVVSGLGDGDTDAGANELERMMEKVRQERTGTDQQPQPLNTQRVMPA
jgi:hypothetical protein